VRGTIASQKKKIFIGYDFCGGRAGWLECEKALPIRRLLAGLTGEG
jgi:hypothetical protein